MPLQQHETMLLRTPSFVCPIEKRVQGSLFFIKTIKTGRNGTVRYGTVRYGFCKLKLNNKGNHIS